MNQFAPQSGKQNSGGSNALKVVAIIFGIIAVCCICCIAVAYFGGLGLANMGGQFLAKEILAEQNINQSPSIQAELGGVDLEKCQMNFQKTQQYDLDNGNNGVVLDVVGKNGKKAEIIVVPKNKEVILRVDGREIFIQASQEETFELAPN